MNRFIEKNHLKTYIALGVVIGLLLLASAVYRSNQDYKDQVSALDFELAQLRTKVAIIRTNKAIAKDKIEDYNKLLMQLIPDYEDFFSMIYALEQLSIKTGFNITGYVIGFGGANNERHSLEIEGNGDSNTFMKFLQDYNFGGGRLITNENIKYSVSSGVGKTTLLINFYTKKIPTQIENVEILTRKDLQLMEQIKDKVSVVIKTGDTEEVASYETKSNPF